MFTGYSTVSSVVVLWLMMGYFYFSYLIRMVVFINRYRSLGCCTALSGKISLHFLLLWRIPLFCPLFFHSLWLDLFYSVDVSNFCWVLTLFWYFVLYCFCSQCCDHCAGFLWNFCVLEQWPRWPLLHNTFLYMICCHNTSFANTNWTVNTVT